MTMSIDANHTPREAIAAQLGFSLPPLNQLLLDAKLIEHPAHHEVHEIRDLLRPMIEPRRCRHDDSAGARETKHVAEVNRAERSFAGYENKLAAFFESDIGRPLDQ